MPEVQTKAPPPNLTGRTLGDFQLLRRIGTGGMGQVYLARQTSLKREVAVKLLRDELSNKPTALARFQAEAQAVAKLNHPNIVHIHQIGEADGYRFMVLEYVNGRNLRDYLARKGPPDLPIAFSIMRQVALALQKAHEQGIVHRDIKPENILVTRKVEVKVTDFGLSRFFAGELPATNLTASGITLGTPLYISPEQVQSSAVDHRSDLYSFGVTCYHLLAGEPPFRGTGAFDVALKHVQEQPPQLCDVRPDLPGDLCGMIHKMMAKDPNDRYQSARDILRDLAKVRDGLNLGMSRNLSQLATPVPSGALALSASEQPVRVSDRRWTTWLFLALGCLLAAGGGAFAYVGMNPPAALPQPQVSVAHVGPGLPELRSTEKIGATTRERELLAVLKNTEETKPDDAIKASVELGLLYVKERRLKDAEERFDKLRGREKEWRDSTARTAHVAARLGQAVVLSHTEGKAEQSNKLFSDVVAEQIPKGPMGFVPGGGPKGDRFAVTVNGTLLRYPDLSAAVADALSRNAVNLNKSKLEPALERLRYPKWVGKTVRTEE